MVIDQAGGTKPVISGPAGIQQAAIVRGHHRLALAP
jgi:hypothetical protein